MLVLFEIYLRKLIIRIESWFWSFNEDMNGITDAHIHTTKINFQILKYSFRKMFQKSKKLHHVLWWQMEGHLSA